MNNPGISDSLPTKRRPDVSRRDRLENDFRGQTRVLERLARGDSLSVVLNTLIEVAEESQPEMIGSILLLDEATGTLRHGASRGLPDFYCEAIDGLEPGPEVGSCGATAFTGRRVIAEDIRTHPFWQNYHELAERASLRACWSEPIIASTGEILGTFAMYYRLPRAPDEHELDFVSSCANLASLAIERVRADRSLRQMAAIVESTDDAIILKSLDGIIESWNKGAERVYGYSAKEAIGQPMEMLVPADRQDELVANIERLSNGEQVDHFETVRVTKSGRRIHVSLTTSPVRDSDGHLTHFVDIQNDITERVNAQLETERERAVLETIVNGVPDALMLANMDRKLTHCNEGALRMFGYEPGELIGQPTAVLYANPKDHELQGRQRFNKSAQEHFEVIEIKWQRKNGEAFLGETVGTVIRNESGEPLGFLAVIRDITDRKRSEEAIREGQRKLATLISNLPGAAYRCRNDENWTMEFLSEGCEELCGYSASEIVANNPPFSEVIHPEDRQHVFDAVQASLANQQPFQLVYRIQHRNGAPRWIWEQGQGVFSEEGELLALEGLMTDTTELQEAREQLLQSERLAAMGKMISAIAHESRNALHRIQMGVDLLHGEFEEESESHEDLDRINSAKADLVHLFEDLKSYAAPIQLDCSTGNLAEAWRQAWSNLELSVAERDAHLVEDTGELDLVCSFDMFRIEQVFRNLFENALAACSDPVQITVSCNDTDNDTDDGGVPEVCISVRDNGPGLTDESRTRVFEAFFTTKAKGTGLGMAIAKRIIEAHQGKIAVGDCKHRGAEFLITLPRVPK